MNNNWFRLKNVLFVLFLLSFIVLSACGGDESAEPQDVAPQEANQEAVVDSDEEVVEEELSPTEVPPTEVPPTATAVPEPTPTIEPTDEPEQETAVSQDDLLAELMLAYNAQQEEGAWRARQTIVDGENSLETVVEHQAPDRYRVTMDIGEAIPFETIMIGDKMYQNLGGTWMELPVDLGSELSDMINDPQSLMEESSFENIEFLGIEDVDGESAKVYRFTAVDTLTDSSTTSEITTWIRESDNLPLKQEITFSDTDVEGQMTQVFEYDVDISIEPPE